MAKKDIFPKFEILAKRCLNCKRYTLTNTNRCPYCVEHSKKGKLIKVTLIEVNTKDD